MRERPSRRDFLKVVVVGAGASLALAGGVKPAPACEVGTASAKTLEGLLGELGQVFGRLTKWRLRCQEQNATTEADLMRLAEEVLAEPCTGTVAEGHSHWLRLNGAPSIPCPYPYTPTAFKGGENIVTERIIAIGDIHGCSAALAALVRAIDPTALDTLVFLGDYIDRGPDSRGVLEQVIALAQRCTVVPLLGNHEEMLLAALEGQSELRYWLKFGGTEALASYGYGGGLGISPAGLRDLIPREHLQFVKGCRNYFETVRHIFVHAYYEPDRPLHEQSWGGLRWASLPPTSKPHCSGKVAIVGHTPQKSGEVLDLGYLKCIDTFCHGGGWLTALEVNTGKVWQANMAGEMR